MVVVASVAFVAGERAGSPPASSTSTTTQPVVTASPGWTSDDADVVGELALAVEQSSATRALTTATLLAVDRCAIPLADAAAQLDTAIAQRRTTIERLETLDADGGLSTATDLLTEALAASLVADEASRRWVDWLARTQATTYTSGCWPPGAAPTTADVELASAASVDAAAARTEFLTLFNPLSAAAGLRSWDASEF
jgi:hypothetical protein